jgi:NADH-quinone oxidoreductase subunit A
MLYNIIFFPPAAFAIVMAAVLLLARVLSPLAYKVKNIPKGAGKAYACGEDVQKNRVQVNYSQFFPFAFFFTILHMVALMITTVPIINERIFLLALIYVMGAMVGLLILFRRDTRDGAD